MPAAIASYQNLGFGREIYVIDIEGTQVITTVTSNCSAAETWLNTVLNLDEYRNRASLVFGLGVEWTGHGSSPFPPAEVLQLCLGEHCLIFQLCHAERVPQNLRTLLGNPNHVFFGFWNNHDRRKLLLSRHNVRMLRDPIDLRLRLESREGFSLSESSDSFIIREWLGYHVNQCREIRMSHWNIGTLEVEQVIYACVDAYCAFAIGSVVGA